MSEKKVVKFKLNKNEMDRIEDLHEKAIIINALAGCRWMSPWKEFGNERAYNFIEMGLKGGVTANSISLHGNNIGEAALEIIEWDKIMASIPNKTQKILTASDIENAKREGKSGYIINFQNTLALQGKLSSIDLFYKLGLRILQLTYQKANLVGDGCGSRRADIAGLTDFGVSVVERMNQLRMVIDLSHVGHGTSSEVIELSKQPPAYTHTSCNGVWKFMRGKSDEDLQALAEKGGVMGINAIARFLWENGDLEGTSINYFLDHIDYAVNLIGIDHVGIGLDIIEGLTPEEYYGIHNQNYEARFRLDPTRHTRRKHPFEHYYVFGLKSISNFKHITEGLVARGYSNKEVLKILGGNWLKYFKTIWGK